MDFYVLLIIPHILALGGMFWFALRIDASDHAEERPDESSGGDGGLEPPRPPSRGPSDGGLPLPDGGPPPRRLRAGEQLADLHPRPARREHDPAPPRRSPAVR